MRCARRRAGRDQCRDRHQRARRGSLGTLYNTMLIIGADGRLLGRHRKLVPTWAEKLTWTGGDGSILRVYQTAIGPLGGARLRREHQHARALCAAGAGRTRPRRELYLAAGRRRRITTWRKRSSCARSRIPSRARCSPSSRARRSRRKSSRRWRRCGPDARAQA